MITVDKCYNEQPYSSVKFIRWPFIGHRFLSFILEYGQNDSMFCHGGVQTVSIPGQIKYNSLASPVPLPFFKLPIKMDMKKLENAHLIDRLDIEYNSILPTKKYLANI